MKLTKKQREILISDSLDPPKILILEGSVRSGKTFLNNALFYKELRRYTGEGKNFIITGHTLGSIKRNVLLSLEQDFDIECRPDNSGSFGLFGNRIFCFGTDRSDSYKDITGMTAVCWYGNEVTLSHPNSRQEAFNRCSEPGARILWDTNPDHPEHPVKVNFIDRSGERLSSGKLRIKSWHFTLEDNTFLPDEYIENLKLSTPVGMWYDRAIKGLWVAAEGIVYEGWNPDIHVIEPFEIPASWTRVRGIDWGYTNPFVMLWGALDPDGRLYIYKEYYVTKTLIKYLAEHINKEKFFVENEGKKTEGKYKWTVADHDAQDNAELKQHGIRTKPAQKAVQTGLQKVAARLIVQEDNKPRLFVFNTCVNTKREMGVYCWNVRQEGKPVKEEPNKVDDHCPDVIRYIVMRLDNKKPMQLFL